MTEVDRRTEEHDFETPSSIELRFGIEFVERAPPGPPP